MRRTLPTSPYSLSEHRKGEGKKEKAKPIGASQMRRTLPTSPYSLSEHRKGEGKAFGFTL